METNADADVDAVNEKVNFPENADIGGGNGGTKEIQTAASPENGVIEGKEKEGEKHAPMLHEKESAKESEKHAPDPSQQVTEDGKDPAVIPESSRHAPSVQPSESGSSTSGAVGRESPSTNGFTDIEKLALAELRLTLEDAILKNKLFDHHHAESESKEESENLLEDRSNEQQQQEAEVNTEISIWGVPLLPSKGDTRTDEVLLKFLRAREFKATESFEMVKNTLQWRRKNNIDSIMDEDFENEFDSVGFMKGSGHEGHPVCYNVYGIFADDEMYNKTFITEKDRKRFLRWRLQLMEKEVRKLDFQPGGISTLIQVNDLKNTPGPSRKDLRLATKQAVEVLQDNYPEFVEKNFFINVPFWYYAFNTLLAPFLTQRTKNKFLFSRPSSVTETLLKCIAAEEMPISYGGLQRDNDTEFSTQDKASEATIKAGATKTIEIPMPKVGTTMIWDLSVSGWDVNYKEEFIPTNEESYAVIVKRGKKITWPNDPIRNSFKNNECGKIAITIENGIFKKKKVLYRYKIKNSDSTDVSI